MYSPLRPETSDAPNLQQATAYFLRLVRLIRPHHAAMLRSVMLGAIGGLISLVPPYLSKLYFDEVFPTRSFSLLHALVFGGLALAAALAVVRSIRAYFTQVVSARLGGAVSLMYLNHLQHLPMSFFDQHRAGEVLSRLGDMRSALGIIARVLSVVLVNGVYVVLVPPFLLLISWRLTIVALFTTPVTAALTIWTSRVVRRYLKRGAEASAELNAVQVEAISQIRTIKTMALEPHVLRTASAGVADAMRLQLNAGAVSTVVSLASSLIRAAGTGLFAWLAWTQILEGRMSLGDFVAFSAYLGYLIGPVNEVTSLFSDFQQAAVSLGRAFEYLDLAPEQEPQQAYDVPIRNRASIGGDIILSTVSFAYVADRPALLDVSLKIPARSVTAIVGATGSGKSSILRLLCRLYRENAGQITIGGQAIDRIPLSELRRQVAVVWQEPTLMRGTIWDNLTLGLSGVSTQVVRAAVAACQLEELIERLPEGYGALVGEWGATLSGGQRQRFAIARALVRDAPILLLDEATSQLDLGTERDLLRSLLAHVPEKTVVIVTHRPLAATLAHHVCLMDKGRAVAAGTHQELLLTSDLYRRLFHPASGQLQDPRPAIQEGA